MSPRHAAVVWHTRPLRVHMPSICRAIRTGCTRTTIWWRARRRLLRESASALVAPSLPRRAHPRSFVDTASDSHCLPPRARRRGNGRWSFDLASNELLVDHVRPKDCYETPEWIWRYYTHREALTLDAHASAINAIAPTYRTRTSFEDVATIPEGTHIWLNPAYGQGGGIGPALDALVGTAVRQRRCTLVALLPNLSYMSWFHRHVMCAHEVHYLCHKVTFANPFLSGKLNESFSPQIVAIWRPGLEPDAPARWEPSAAVPPAHNADVRGECLRIRCCVICSKWRLLPRHQSEPSELFECSLLLDVHRNSCSSPQAVCAWDA